MYAPVHADAVDVEGDEGQHIHQRHRLAHPRNARADGMLGQEEACFLDAAPHAHEVLEGKESEEEPSGVVAELSVP